jgi:hypothetical protein
MKNRFRAMGMLRTVREKLGRLNRVLMEAGSSDEDLVFHIRKSKSERPLRDQASRTTHYARPKAVSSDR